MANSEACTRDFCKRYKTQNGAAGFSAHSSIDLWREWREAFVLVGHCSLSGSGMQRTRRSGESRSQLVCGKITVILSSKFIDTTKENDCVANWDTDEN